MCGLCASRILARKRIIYIQAGTWPLVALQAAQTAAAAAALLQSVLFLSAADSHQTARRIGLSRQQTKQSTYSTVTGNYE